MGRDTQRSLQISLVTLDRQLARAPGLECGAITPD